MSATAIIPVPRIPIATRPAVPDDLPFIDGLQKRHTHMVGWMPTKQLVGKIRAGHVIVAEATSAEYKVLSAESEAASPTQHSGLRTQHSPLGYCIGHDQYFKRDDVGIIYQVNVAPAARRGLVGAAMVRAMFDRAAYGCRLFCCWCAQDIDANRFWESLGFVPLAFRAGSRDKGRVHIFWQRRIRADDATTPYWFPSQTAGGSIREDRLVFPIPPGVHWRDAMPRVLPGEELPVVSGQLPVAGGQLPPKRQRAKPAPAAAAPAKPTAVAALSGFSFAAAAPPRDATEKPKGEPKRPPKPKAKNDPRLVAAARELRDRWLEHANAHPAALLSRGKYDLGRAPAAERLAVTVGVAAAARALPAPAVAA